MTGKTMTADRWLSTPEFRRYTVADPDGWDRKNFDVSWNEKIDRDEFIRRLTGSTVLIRLTK